MMRRSLTIAMLAGLGLALPSWAFGQAASMPVIPAVQATHAKKNTVANAPVWQHEGNSLSVTANGHTGTVVPSATAGAIDGQTHSAGAGVRFTTNPGLTAHANVQEIRWTPVVPGCASVLPGVPNDSACLNTFADGVQHGEVGAGFAGHGVKLDLSVGQSQSEPAAAPVRRAALPRVLPAEGGADVAAPLWFRNSTATSISARGQLDLAPDTSVKVGASIGRVRFLPGSGLANDDTLDQTTLSLGVQHGAVRGSIVGHVLEPNLPGAALDQNQRWSGIDLGISVRLPWRGELNFGAQNVWTSGHAPMLFGPGVAAPDQGRVPYVQYHQDL